MEKLDSMALQHNLKLSKKIVDKVTKPLSTKRQLHEDIVDYSGLSNIKPIR